MLRPIIKLYQNAFTGLSANSWFLSVVMLINRSGTMVIPFMSVYMIQRLHFSIIQAGWVMAFFGIGALAGAFFGGKLTDKAGFYDVQVGALLLGGIFFIALGYQHTFFSISLLTLVLSVCNESFRPANAAAIAHYSNETNKTRSYSLNRLAVNLGWAVGGGLGGFLASINFHLLFWVDGCTNIFAAAMLLLLLPRAAIKKTVYKTMTVIRSASAYRDYFYLIFILLNTLFSCCFYEFFISQPVFFTAQWHFSERFVGLLLTLNGLLIVLIEMLLVHRLDGRKNPLFFIAFGVLLSGISFALLNLLPHNSIAALLVVGMITMGEIISMPFMNAFWVSRTTAGNRGEYAALYGMSWSAAQIIAPFSGSLIIAHNGFDGLWWTMTGICFLVAVGYYLMLRSGQKSSIPVVNRS